MIDVPRYLVMIQTYGELGTEAINSLNMQTLIPTKILVVDDGFPGNKIENETKSLKEKYPGLIIDYFRGDLKPDPNLDTVGKVIKKAWFASKKDNYDFVSIIDADSALEPEYYTHIISLMQENENLVCASGELVVVDENKKYIEEINIGAKIGRKDARGSGKIIEVSFLDEIDPQDFPDVAWDTWINTRAKLKGFKAKQIEGIRFYASRPTSRVIKKDLYRSGRLTFHFGYNPLLVILKVILARTGAITFLKGYFNARKQEWKLEDKKVRSFFGWRFIFHF